MTAPGIAGREPAPAGVPRVRAWQRLLPWLVTLACFVYLYRRLEGTAVAAGTSVLPYLGAVFEHVGWARWLALMIPYCALFVAVDSLIVWRVITWFNARVAYASVLRIRASAYILSIVNEQVGKGAIAFYLSRRHGIPGWEVGSSMLFLMVCEYYYLLAWATLGVALEWDRFPTVFHAIPWIALASVVLFVVFYFYINGGLGVRSRLRDRSIFRAFRRARLRHYAAVVLLRSPLMLAAVATYRLALGLFGVAADVREMFGYLPVIFFGAAMPGPMRSVAIVLWVVLFPGRAGEMTAFGFVQHNFFVLFNAAVGLAFLRQAAGELFQTAP